MEQNQKFTILFLAVGFLPVICHATWYPPDNVCIPNPVSPQDEQLSVPLSCPDALKEGLLNPNPDTNKNMSQLLDTYNYLYEVHEVTTKDGYILTVYRITGSPKLNKSQNAAQKPAVLLQHGITLASDCWNFQPDSRNLPFKLADAGYEVWIGNARGTSYSLGHTTLNSATDLKYWDFSWHEMGIYDMPALTDYVREVSGNSKIFYVGHSMGTTQFFVANSLIPEMNEKFHAGFMLSPIAYQGHMNNPSKYLFGFVASYQMFTLVNELSRGKFPSVEELREKYNIDASVFCDPTLFQCGLCDNVFYAIFGYNKNQMNNTQLPNLLTKMPNSFSIKTAAHYGQSMTRCTFRQFDYGNAGNLLRYGSLRAPDYPLEKITAPLYFYYGEADNMGPPNDVLITVKKLKPGVLRGLIKVNDTSFNHMDFILAKDGDILVYDDVLEKMRSISTPAA